MAGCVKRRFLKPASYIPFGQVVFSAFRIFLKSDLHDLTDQMVRIQMSPVFHRNLAGFNIAEDQLRFSFGIEENRFDIRGLGALSAEQTMACRFSA